MFFLCNRAGPGLLTVSTRTDLRNNVPPQDFSRNDRVLLQRLHRPRRAFGTVSTEGCSTHDRATLPLPWLQRPVRPLRAHHSAHYGRSAHSLRGRLTVDVLPKRPGQVLTLRP